MRNLLGICAVILTLSPFAAAYAQSTGKELLQSCEEVMKIQAGKSKPDYAMAMECVGYIHGITNGHDATTYLQTKRMTGGAPWDDKSESRRRSLAIYCASPSVQTGKEVGIVVRYLRRHRKQLDEQAATLVFDALKTAYPCK